MHHPTSGLHNRPRRRSAPRHVSPSAASTRRLERCALVILSAVVFLSLAAPLSADELPTIEATCPVDGTKLTAKSYGQASSTGTYPDFMKKGPMAATYCGGVLTCPTCGYSGFGKDMSAPLGDEEKAAAKALIAKVLAELGVAPGTFTSLEGWHGMTLAVAIARAKGTLDAEQAGYGYLVATWCHRHQHGEAEDGAPGVVAVRKKALAAFEEALAKGLVAPEDIPQTTYLVGELYRLNGAPAKALEWFEKAKQSALVLPPWLDKLIDQQSKLAVKPD